jgi:hypothetical protein
MIVRGPPETAATSSWRIKSAEVSLKELIGRMVSIKDLASPAMKVVS